MLTNKTNYLFYDKFQTLINIYPAGSGSVCNFKIDIRNTSVFDLEKFPINNKC